MDHRLNSGLKAQGSTNANKKSITLPKTKTGPKNDGLEEEFPFND